MPLRTLLLLTISCSLAACRAQPPAAAHAPDRLPEPPPELLKYRNDSANPFDAGGLLPTDTNQVYRNVTSYPTLRAVILDDRAEPEVLPFAIERALLLVGPTTFFSDVRQDAARRPRLFAAGPRRELLERSRQPHAWVGASVFIDEAAMPRTEARKILERITADVRAGESFGAVYSRVRNAHAYDDGPTHRTRVGNYGDWVISTTKPTAEPFRWASVPPSHVEPLLAARAGDLLLLENDDPDKRSLILYHVRERYQPQ